MYYRYIDAIVRGVAADAKSLLDVGSASAQYLEEFDWIETKIAVDLKTPYSSASVKGITANFFDYSPDVKFDLVTCFQVLEHVPEAGRFAQKLFEVGRDVLISVPYQWPEKSNAHHVHDPVDRKKLRKWTGREPDYSVVVSEVFLQEKGQRLIAYYREPGQPFSRMDARQAMTKSMRGA
jgi:hypothetical protein